RAPQTMTTIQSMRTQMNERLFCKPTVNHLMCLALLLLAIIPSQAEAETHGSACGVVSALQPFVDSHSLAGAVTLVATKDKVLDVEALGFADIAAGKAMRPDALFWIASESKPMTAAVFMMLVDEGKVSLGDAVEKYLPEFKGQMLVVEGDAEHVL